MCSRWALSPRLYFENVSHSNFGDEMNNINQIGPHAREDGLIVRIIDNEIIVYDKERDKAHCLNQTAALVWNNCDGKRSVAEIARRMQAELNAPVETNVVWYALKQLDKYQLLQDPISLPEDVVALTRREFLKKVGVAAAVAVPMIFSITAPTPAFASTCKPTGASCGSGVECCSGICTGGGTCQ
jgi:hypothetical protein